jgi:hypothetical protein
MEYLGSRDNTPGVGIARAGSRSILDPNHGGIDGIQINIGTPPAYVHHIHVENYSVYDFGGQGMLIGSGGASRGRHCHFDRK